MTRNFVFDPDYSDVEALWTQPKAVLARARSASRMSAVLLKIARDPGDPAAKSAWEREYGILKDLGADGAGDPPCLETWNGVPVLVLADTGAMPLSRHEPLSFAEPKRFLRVAAEICAQVERLHLKGLIHQFLTPDNLLINSASFKSCLIGLVHASPFFSKARGAFDLRIREGGLCCLAPEQTGMINRLMDGRTDIYALGCIFFEMLAGRPVCESESSHDIMAFHLTGQPKLKSEGLKVIPAIAAVVEKCLAKEPDERYQTIGGLSADIQTCLDKLRESGKIASFAPGRHDVCPVLRPPGRLVGRDDEIRGLSRAVEKAARGGHGACFVSGLPGVGKTVLVSETFPLIAAHKMALLSGKFEPVTDNRPYAGICQAVSAWAISINWEDESRKKDWMARLGRAMGGLGRIIADLAPEAAFLFGEAEALPDFPPREAQGRFFLALSRFFSAIAEKDGLVLFLDDLQWADQSTLSFLAQAATGSISGRFLLLGAFRDNEIAPENPLHEIIAACLRQGKNCRAFNLAPLGRESLASYIEEICGGAPPKGRELLEHVFSCTSGNPFYARELLHSFVEDGCLFFDHGLKRFSFNAQKAGNRVALPDQRAILRRQILSLSERCREMLCVAAAVGNVFSPGTVALLLDKPPGMVTEHLAEAAARELVRPVSGMAGGYWYDFSHDHVREEAYSLLPPGRAAAMHLALSRLDIPGLDPASAAYFAADHVNLSAGLLTGEKERMDAALKNLEAGRLAREAAAFGPAWRYLSAAISFLPENAWKKHYKTTLEIYTAAAEAAYLVADKDVASRLSAIIIKEARSDMDRAKALWVAFLALVAQNRQAEAIETGLKALRALGIKMPANPGKAHLLYYYLKARLALPRRKWNKLLTRPDKGPARKALAMSISLDLGLSAFGLRPNLTVAAGLQQVALLSRGRLCPQAAAALAGYALMLGQVGKAGESYELGLLAEKLQKRWPGHQSEATTLCIVNSIIKPWKQHLRESYTGLAQAYDTGMRAGNFYWGTMGAWVKCYQLFYAGIALSEVDRQMRKLRDEVKAMGQEKWCLHLDMDILCVMALNGASEKEICEERKACGNPDEESKLLEAGEEIALCIFYANKLLIDYLFGNYESAAACGRSLDKYPNGMVGTQALPVTELLDCLSMLASPEPFADRKRLNQKIARLSGWAKNCPPNNSHKIDLVNAEMARVKGRNGEARRLYARAVESAKENGFMNFEALGLELFAKFCLINDEIGEGTRLMAQARSAYAAWGATAKVKSLDEKYGALFLRPGGRMAESPLRSERPSLSGLADTTRVLAGLKEKLKAAPPQNRADVFLRLICPLAGASAGVIFIRDHRALAVKALWRGEGADEEKYDSITAEEPDRFFARKAISLSDWVLVPDLSKADLPHKYRRSGSAKARSILCGPLETDWKKGALYLENRFLTDAFDPVRLNMVKAAAELFSSLQHPLGRFHGQ